eukprot:TRINITY_DN11776_c0_g2_i1.p2 TRINITY_DN11776_c0_g2~~TRINITY_DN11776_c0_g2_i1.p2  ORF type:complete len:108 (+),score=12.27 TRINITY_DN11776_c0_g2_i1:508-831(+)
MHSIDQTAMAVPQTTRPSGCHVISKSTSNYLCGKACHTVPTVPYTWAALAQAQGEGTPCTNPACHNIYSGLAGPGTRAWAPRVTLPSELHQSSTEATKAIGVPYSAH